jgi:hypothetical protein
MSPSSSKARVNARIANSGRCPKSNTPPELRQLR